MASSNGLAWAPQAMVATVNNLLQPQAQAAWRELSTGEQLRAATMLLDTVEQGAFVLADNLLKTDIVQENTDNIREYAPPPGFPEVASEAPPSWLAPPIRLVFRHYWTETSSTLFKPGPALAADPATRFSDGGGPGKPRLHGSLLSQPQGLLVACCYHGNLKI